MDIRGQWTFAGNEQQKSRKRMACGSMISNQ
jgi:hypothetical protein